ncbi:hypothetical protein [Janthinobacterium psychrotolerans]|uniref:Uncharacterized protein n=1 Tax=Janthinobacterium psychrotolerans TaxID=1747903 RepID=A0A1A7BZK6_9BURK|nr:hypothetical protein [Janthinobacterium psychrotolerans]OBV38932.1 hypothetical protein ASR47_1007248 [Janthinobacterium psychrotolerans]
MGIAVPLIMVKLANYHIINTGQCLLDELSDCVRALAQAGGVLEMMTLEGVEPFYYVL